MVAVAGAIGQALELVAAPAGLQQARSRNFPDDVTQMLRLVAGDAGTLEQVVIASNETEDSVREAAEFFVLQVCFTPGIDSYRVLAANREDTTSRIREHYRLLVRWLHPDRNPDAWQTVYLDRVNRAWRDLRNPEERAEYDRLGPDHEAAEAADPINKMPIGAEAAGIAVESGKRVSARTMRQLPAVVLGGLVVLAVVVLGLMYADYQADHRARQALAFSASEEVDPTPDKPPARVPPSVRAEMVPTPLPAEPSSTSAASDIAVPAPELAATVIEPAPTPTPVLDQNMPSAPNGRAEVAGAEPVKAPGVESLTPVTTLADAFGRRDPSAESATRAEQVAALPVQGSQNTSAPSVDAVAPTPSILTSGVVPDVAPVATAGNQLDPMPGEAVDRLLEKFRRAYDEGNLIGLMALFTRDARNIADGSKTLADDYRELFATSSARALSLTDMSWWREGEQIVVIARFNAAIKPSGRPRARQIGGDIRFELRREDGEVRIARIRHQVQ